MATNISIVHRFSGQVVFVTDGLGTVTGFLAATELDIRDALGELIVDGAAGPLPLDLWPQLSAAQKTSLQNIYNAIVSATLPTVTSVS